MFDISALKEMKLSELQEIAKSAKTIKFNGVKKENFLLHLKESEFRRNYDRQDLYQILAKNFREKAL